MRNGKGTKSFLPRKAAANPSFTFASWLNNAGTFGDRENNVEIDLRIGVGHFANYMSLLAELIV